VPDAHLPTSGPMPSAAPAASTPWHASLPADASARTRAYIDFMVRCDVLTFGDFVGKSGRRMPYFVNAGRYRTGGQVGQLGRFYAAAIADVFGDGVDVLFGPAYKGIPLAVTTAIALAEEHGHDVGFCFDRKEAKDHGEGGWLVGHQLRDGDRVVIVEDVTTAGTSVRATIPLLRATAGVEVVGLVVGVDRRERGPEPSTAPPAAAAGDDRDSREDRGTGEDNRALEAPGVAATPAPRRSALEELAGEFGLTTVALATIDDIVEHLTGREVDGRPVLTDADLGRIAAYRAEHGVG
jgi:orotate phosphoribosyltransferase